MQPQPQDFALPIYSIPSGFVGLAIHSHVHAHAMSPPFPQLSFSFFVWLSIWLGLYMMTSNVYALTQLQSRYIYVSSRDYNDSSQMVLLLLQCSSPCDAMAHIHSPQIIVTVYFSFAVIVSPLHLQWRLRRCLYLIHVVGISSRPKAFRARARSRSSIVLAELDAGVAAGKKSFPANPAFTF